MFRKQPDLWSLRNVSAKYIKSKQIQHKSTFKQNLLYFFVLSAKMARIMTKFKQQKNFFTQKYIGSMLCYVVFTSFYKKRE